MRDTFKFKGFLFSLAIIPASIIFTQDLRLGSNGPEVTNLQRILNSDGRTAVALTGTGSAGQESSYFGALTKAAIMRFQSIYKDDILKPAGLSIPTGIVGINTRKKLNSLLSDPSPAIQTPASLGISSSSSSDDLELTGGTGVFKGDALLRVYEMQAKSIGVNYKAPRESSALAVDAIRLDKSSPLSVTGDGTIYIEGTGFETENTIYSSLGTLQHIPSSDGTHIQFKVSDMDGYKTMSKFPIVSNKILSIFFHVGNKKGVSRDAAYFNITFK